MVTKTTSNKTPAKRGKAAAAKKATPATTKRTSRAKSKAKPTPAEQEPTQAEQAEQDEQENQLPQIHQLQLTNFVFRYLRAVGASSEDIERISQDFSKCEEKVGEVKIHIDTNQNTRVLSALLLGQGGEEVSSIVLNNIAAQRLGIAKIGEVMRLTVELGSLRPNSQWLEYDIAKDDSPWFGTNGEVSRDNIYGVTDAALEGAIDEPIFEWKEITFRRNQILVETSHAEDVNTKRRFFFL